MRIGWVAVPRVVIALTLLCVAWGALAVAPTASAGSLCDQLADKARALPSGSWSRGVEALGRWVRINQLTSQPPPFEASLASLPAVLKALGDENGALIAWVDHLAGTDIYAVYDVQGTLHCQDMIFLQASTGRPARMIAKPPSVQRETCWTESAGFGRVLGQPVLIRSTSLAVTSDGDGLEITPWTGQAWGAACRLRLRYKLRFDVSERYCGDSVACRAAGEAAKPIAELYDRAAPDQRADGRFHYGPERGPAWQATRATLERSNHPDFPTFGAKPRTPYPQYSGAALFPLTLDGRDYVGAVGYGSVGWREIGDTLFSVYSAEGETLRPVAGIVVVRIVTGLASVRATSSPP